MAEDTVKSLEMRVAELEDKLSKLNITEEEMKAYRKVTAALGGGFTTVLPPGLTTPAVPFFGWPGSFPLTSPQICVLACVRPGLTSVLPPLFGSPGGFGTLGS